MCCQYIIVRILTFRMTWDRFLRESERLRCRWSNCQVDPLRGSAPSRSNCRYEEFWIWVTVNLCRYHRHNIGRLIYSNALCGCRWDLDDDLQTSVRKHGGGNCCETGAVKTYVRVTFLRPSEESTLGSGIWDLGLHHSFEVCKEVGAALLVVKFTKWLLAAQLSCFVDRLVNASCGGLLATTTLWSLLGILPSDI